MEDVRWDPPAPTSYNSLRAAPVSGALMIQVGATLNQRFYHRVEYRDIARLVTICRSIVPPGDGDERTAKRTKTSSK
ncbi:hypothetical protein PGQ11_006123 [Apiospora arundinis]|uniref:Uncharacterized protein n=1 Tax=Apiospora arundinis TaxID=335852 RepID=A0ABR2IRQ5_9PEZI